METYRIAIIDINKFVITDDIIESNNDLRSFIRDNIDKFVTLVDTNINEMIKIIIDTVEHKENLICNTDICYEDNKVVYQLCHISPECNNMELDQDKINGISSYLIESNLSVYGKTVLLKSLITKNTTCQPITIYMDDIIELIYRKNIHKCVLVTTNNDIEELTYIKNPLEHIMDISEYQIKEHSLFLYNLLIFHKPVNYKTEEKIDINSTVTRILGDRTIYGDVIIATRTTEHIYADITKQELVDIDALCWGELKNRNIEEILKHEDKKIDGLVTTMNKHILINKLLKNKNRACDQCAKLLNNNKVNEYLVCTECYRMRYDSEECQKAHWDQHKEECLNHN